MTENKREDLLPYLHLGEPLMPPASALAEDKRADESLANLCKPGSLSSASFSGSRRGKRRISLCFPLAPKGAVAQSAPINPSGESAREGSIKTAPKRSRVD